jgi:hypothetical protein
MMMTKTAIFDCCLRFALSGLLMAGTVFLFASAASAQASQCGKNRINYEECWVAVQVSGSSLTVTPSDVAVYSETKISWKRTDTPNPPDKPDFAVDFDSAGCTPFGGVFHFDQSTAAPIADELPRSHFESCKYKVTVGSLTADQQVIVIGGPKRRPTSWSRRHLGEW